MNRFVVLFFLLIPALPGYASLKDSLFLHPGINGNRIIHQVIPGETIASLSRRYFVTPELLAEANGMSNRTILESTLVSIPLGEYNVTKIDSQSSEMLRPLYYRIQQGDNVYHVSNLVRVPMEQLVFWNGPLIGHFFTGRAIQVGWVRYDPTSFETGAPSVVRPLNGLEAGDTGAEYLIIPLTTDPEEVKAHVPPSLEQEWMEQTIEGLNAVTEKGTVGFFPITENAAGAAVYAFHNAAARGTVMRVRNTNNGRIIYVKVLGPLPETKMFAGCVLGLSNGAKAALDVRETKAFCEMSYAGY